MTFESPTVKRHTVQVDAVGTAGNDSSSIIGEAPFAGTVTRAVYIPSAAITGANTNSRTITITNRTAAGTGTTVVATLPLVSGVNPVKDAVVTIPLSGTPANLVVAQGDILTADSLHIGTGITDPGGSVEVDISRS